MEAPRLRPWRRLWPLWLLLGLCFPPGARGQGDFDLADALDDPDPTKKPSSDLYPKPKPPAHPQPGFPENSGNIYPRPKPRPQPGGADNSGGHFNTVDDGRYPPRPRPPSGGGGGGGYDSYGNTHGGGGGGYGGYGDSHGGGGSRPRNPYRNPYGGDGQSTHGDPQGNMVARIVSPVVSVVVVALVGAGVSYFRSNRRRNCFGSRDPETV